MDATDVSSTVEIGERARDAQHAVIAACGKPHRLGSVAQELEAGAVGFGDLLEHGALRLRVGAYPRKPERGVALRLHLSRGVDARGDLDRKSTRLNSSHRCISYAVFCLKKKKK